MGAADNLDSINVGARATADRWQGNVYERCWDAMGPHDGAAQTLAETRDDLPRRPISRRALIPLTKASTVPTGYGRIASSHQ
jgi:hypothetical protein